MLQKWMMPVFSCNRFHFIAKQILMVAILLIMNAEICDFNKLAEDNIGEGDKIISIFFGRNWKAHFWPVKRQTMPRLVWKQTCVGLDYKDLGGTCKIFPKVIESKTFSNRKTTDAWFPAWNYSDAYRPPTPRPPKLLRKVLWAPTLGKFKILFWVLSSLIHFREWFLKEIRLRCKNPSNFHQLVVPFSKNFLIHNVLWLSNVVLY